MQPPPNAIESALSSPDNTITYPFQRGVVPPLKQIDDDYKALKVAIQAGHIENAQSAFAALQSDKTSAVTHGMVEPNAPANNLSTHFQTLRSALQSGDIARAKSAFAAVDQVVKEAYSGSRSSIPNAVTPISSKHALDRSPGSIFSAEA